MERTKGAPRLFSRPEYDCLLWLLLLLLLKTLVCLHGAPFILLLSLLR